MTVSQVIDIQKTMGFPEQMNRLARHHKSILLSLEDKKRQIFNNQNCEQNENFDYSVYIHYITEFQDILLLIDKIIFTFGRVSEKGFFQAELKCRPLSWEAILKMHSIFNSWFADGVLDEKNLIPYYKAIYDIHLMVLEQSIEHK